MKPINLSRLGLKTALGVITLAGPCLGLADRTQAQELPNSQVQTPNAQRPTPNAASTGMLMGLQTVYLRAPILRFYTGAPVSNAPIPQESLQLANFSVGSNRRLYPNLDKVRATVAKDEALGAFLQDPRTGPALRQALQEATLYACLPRQGLAGFNEFNTMNALPGKLRPARAAGLGAQAPAQPVPGATTGSSTVSGATEATGNTIPAASVTQPGFLGDVQKVNPQGSVQGAGNGAVGLTGARIASARQAALRDFSTLVVLSPDGKRANLYVMGSLPDSLNPAVPVNFTAEAKQYTNGARSVAGVDQASEETLLDKQALPTATDGARYFCFVYPLVTPDAATQSDVLVSYWPDTAVAVTHGVALAHSDTLQAGESGAAAQWITIPMTRLQTYQARKDSRHALLVSVEPGDPLVDARARALRAARQNNLRQRNVRQNNGRQNGLRQNNGNRSNRKRLNGIP